MIESKLFIRPNLEINYFYQNTGKPCIIMLHGLTDSALYWERVANKLKHYYDYILVDLRGHGLSSKPRSGYTYKHFVEDMLLLFSRLDIHDPIIMGHSIGADIALLYANRSERSVRGLILEDPPWTDIEISHSSKEIEEYEQRDFINEAQKMTIEELMKYCQSTSPNSSEQDLKNWALSQKLVSPQVAEWITSEYINWREEVSKVIYPTLLLTGDTQLDSIVTPKIAKEFLLYCRYGIHVNIPESGHTIHRDQFDKFMKAIIEFINSLSNKPV